jgi:SAM-dependent methyltransferase
VFAVSEGSAGTTERYVHAERVHWWYRGRRRILLPLLERYLAGGGRRILDIGSGSGAMLLLLRRFGTVRGTESDPDLVRHARSQGLDIVVQDFPRQIPEGRFDVVTLFDVLEHLEDDRAALASIHGLLEPGGLLFITVPALPWLYSTYDEASGHYRRYDRNLLLGRLRETGFRLLHRTHFNTLLLPLAVAARMFRLRPGNRPPPASTCERLAALQDQDLRIPSPPVNELLALIFGAETSWASGPGLPTGVSLLAVARKEGAGFDNPLPCE